MMLNDRPLPQRVNVPVEQTWDKTDVYSSDAAWEAALREASQAASDLGRFRGRLRESAATQSGAYGLHPFVLVSYEHSFLSVSTLAHEIGHAMHTYFTNQAQPTVYENYASYLGETASTLSQALLRAHVLRGHDADLQLEALSDARTVRAGLP